MKRRVLGFGDCCYHIVSRINERRFYLGDDEKQHFLTLLYQAADFSGVEILTYCIMDDHFHLLIRVPTPKSISDKELLRRIQVLYKPEEYEVFRDQLKAHTLLNNQALAHAFRQRFTQRMYSLSEFVRTLKLRFSIWYNRKHDREGTLWTARFKSALIESSSDEYGFRALHAVASYIDLNAVRAELVNQAENYPWCGFAQAAKGDRKLLKAMKYIFGRHKKGTITAKTALGRYKTHLGTASPSKIDCLTSGWIVGKHSFVDFVSRRRPECFRTGLFDITMEIAALQGSGLYTIKCLRHS